MMNFCSSKLQTNKKHNVWVKCILAEGHIGQHWAETLLHDVRWTNAEAQESQVGDWLTPEWLQEVIQEYAPKQAKEMGWQTIKQIAEALKLPDLEHHAKRST